MFRSAKRIKLTTNKTFRTKEIKEDTKETKRLKFTEIEEIEEKDIYYNGYIDKITWFRIYGG